jgi:hypothetical protein
MLHRIEVDVVDMPRQVGLVTDRVLPIAALPQSFLAFSDVSRRSRCRGWKSARNPGFDQIPARGKIRVILRQRPDGVQVIRQDADRNCLERVAF